MFYGKLINKDREYGWILLFKNSKSLIIRGLEINLKLYRKIVIFVKKTRNILLIDDKNVVKYSNEREKLEKEK